jgi:hypothetical protein
MTVFDALLAPAMPILHDIEQQDVQESIRLKLVETRQLLTGVVLFQDRRETGGAFRLPLNQQGEAA